MNNPEYAFIGLNQPEYFYPKKIELEQWFPLFGAYNEVPHLSNQFNLKIKTLKFRVAQVGDFYSIPIWWNKNRDYPTDYENSNVTVLLSNNILRTTEDKLLDIENNVGPLLSLQIASVAISVPDLYRAELGLDEEAIFTNNFSIPAYRDEDSNTLASSSNTWVEVIKEKYQPEDLDYEEGLLRPGQPTILLIPEDQNFLNRIQIRIVRTNQLTNQS